MEIREHVLEYLKTLKSYTSHKCYTESGETKEVYTEKEYWEGKVLMINLNHT